MQAPGSLRTFACVCARTRVCAHAGRRAGVVRAVHSVEPPVNQRAALRCHFCIKKASTSYREWRFGGAETQSRLPTRSPEHKIRSSSKKFSRRSPSVLPLRFWGGGGGLACDSHGSKPRAANARNMPPPLSSCTL